MQCLNCQEETSNPKFCCRSCAATFNNKTTPKRLRKTKCSKCDSITKSWRHTLCESHWIDWKDTQFKDKTLGEYREKQSVAGKHPSWINAHVRSFARSWLSHLTKLPCAHCNYDKHVELAHIRAVSDFKDHELLKEVNSESNVIQLCPNCHWEFDNLPRS